MEEKKQLNPEQVKAIKHQSGPLLIIAGAGTGKTTVITQRINYLITKGLAKPSEILALTFTEKAAREMETRVDEAMPYGYTQMWMMTFHSFCDRVLRDQALHIGLDPKYKLTTEAEAIQLIRKNLFRFDLDYFRPLGNPNKFIAGILQHFSRLQDEDVSPNDYSVWVKKQKTKKAIDRLDIKQWTELAGAYHTYEELKIKENLFDFGDLIVKTLQLFRTRPNILKQYQCQFKYVLVDEFQDTNFAQNELVKILVGKNGNITVVCDDDQAIYRWRGAAVSNVIQFRKSFPKTKIITLTKNYRCPQEILDRAYALIQYNNPDRLEVVEKIDKKLVAVVKKLPTEVKFLHADRVENEAELVAKEIKKLETEEQYAWKDMAILVRANNHAEPFTRALARHGLPFQFLGPGRLFKQPEIIDLIAYLKVLYNFEDSVAFYRVLSIEAFDLPARDLAVIGNISRRKNLSLFEVALGTDKLPVAQKTKEAVGIITALITKHLKLVRKETAGQLLYYFLEKTGLMRQLLSPDTPEAEKKALNISKFFDKLKTYEVDHEDAAVQAVVDWIELSSELGESPRVSDTDWTEVDAVNLLTLHSAKGLEFPVVFLVNLVGQRFPTIERREQIPIPDQLVKEILPKGDYHLQEERRLFYVGMTRAKERLYLTAADYYGEGKREKRLSPFIFEALGDKALSSEQPENNSQQLSFLDYKASGVSVIKPQPLSIHLDYLSVSQIETFKVCPLHYKLKYLYKVPTPSSAAQSFGIAMHATLKSFYEAIKTGETPKEKVILKCLEDSWMDEGYGSKAHEHKFFEKGRLYLKGFLKEGFNSKILPALMEQPFVIPLHLPYEKPLKIGGKIDRVDVFADGTIEIIDYKTGATIPNQREVDTDLQLSFYALAASKIPEEPFARNPEEIKLSLYFLDTQEKISTVRTKEQLDRAIKDIFDWRQKIETSDFACSGGMLCKTCEYKLLCLSTQE